MTMLAVKQEMISLTVKQNNKCRCVTRDRFLYARKFET